MCIERTCPKCGYTGTCMIIRYNNKKIVLDACIVCGTKLTDEQEENNN